MCAQVSRELVELVGGIVGCEKGEREREESFERIESNSFEWASFCG